MSYKYIKGRYGSSTKSIPKLKPSFFLRLIKPLLILLAILLVFAAISPFAARYYLLDYFKKKGFETKIEQIGYNPFTERMTVVGLSLYKNDEQKIDINRLTADINVPDLFRKNLKLGRVSTRGVELHYRQNFPSQHLLGAYLDELLSDISGEWQFSVGAFVADETEICRHLQLIRYEPSVQCLSVRNISVGNVLHTRVGNEWQITTGTPIRAERLYLQDQATGLSALYLGEGAVRQLILAQGLRKISQLELNNFHLVETSVEEAAEAKSRFQTQFGQLTINNIDYRVGKNKPSVLNIGEVEAESLRQTLHKNRDSAFVAISRLRKFFPSVELALNNEAANPEQPSMHMSIERIRFVDGAVAWPSLSGADSAQKRFFGLNMEFGRIDSFKPDEPTPLTILAKLDRNGGISVRGLTFPFTSNMQYELHGSIQGLDLSSVSNYAYDVFNEHINGGNLDAQFDVISDGSDVDVDSIVRLENMQIDDSKKKKNKKTKINFSELYDLLRSARGALEFSAQFNFDANSPRSFYQSFGKAVSNRLFAQANKNYRAARAGGVEKKVKNNKSYLSENIIDGKRAAFAISIEPFYFDAKKIKLANYYDERLEAMIRLMKGTVDLNIDICATSTAGEWSTIFNDKVALKFQSDMQFAHLQHLVSLSRSRAKGVKQRLMNKGIDAKRISDCRAKVDQADSGEPYVSISMR